MQFKDVTVGRTLIFVNKKADHEKLVQLLLDCKSANILAPGHWSVQLNGDAIHAFVTDEVYYPNGQLLAYAASVAHGWRTTVDRIVWIGLIPSRWHPAYPTFLQALNRSPSAPVFRHVGMGLTLESELQPIALFRP